MAEDLFASAVDEQLSRRAPLADRLRPRSLDDIMGQSQLIGDPRYITFAHKCVEDDQQVQVKVADIHHHNKLYHYV